MTMKFGAVVIAGLGFAAATPSFAQEVAATHTPADSEITIPAPPEGMGQVVFFRSSSMMGMAMGCQVNEGEGEPKDAKVSSLGNGRYFILQTTPGTHGYWTRNEKKDELTLLVEPDETQFVRCKIKMGIMSGRPDIRPSDGAEFAKASGSMKLVDDDDMKADGVLRAAQLTPVAMAE